MDIEDNHNSIDELDELEDEVLKIMEICKNTCSELEKMPECDVNILNGLGVDFASSVEKVRLGILDQANSHIKPLETHSSDVYIDKVIQNINKQKSNHDNDHT